jgi:hypothetical protein
MSAEYDLDTSPEFPVLGVEEILAGTSSHPLVGDWIAEGAFTAFYGPEWSGKSLAGLGLTLSLASGTPWLGIDVPQASALYVVCEGRGGLKDRIAAWQFAHPGADTTGWDAHVEGFSFADPRQVEALLHYLEIIRPAICLFDTIATTIGGDENSNVDMGKLIGACLEIQRITSSTTAPALIGHPGKDPSKGLRGHSSLPASLESIIRVSGIESQHKATDIAPGEPTGGSITFYSKKSKDGARVPDLGATLRSGGRSVYLVPSAPASGLTDSQLRLLRELAEGGGTSSWSVWGHASGLHRNTINAARTGLLDAHLVDHQEASGLVLITDHGAARL